MGEALHRLQVIERHHASKALPGFDQACGGPISCEFREFLLAGKGLHASPGCYFGFAKALMVLSASIVNTVMFLSLPRVIRSHDMHGSI